MFVSSRVDKGFLQSSIGKAGKYFMAQENV